MKLLVFLIVLLSISYTISQVTLVGYSTTDTSCTKPLLSSYYPQTCSAYTGGLRIGYAYASCSTGPPLLYGGCGNRSCTGDCSISTLPPMCAQAFPNIFYTKYLCSSSEAFSVKPDIQYDGYSDSACTTYQQSFNQTLGCFSTYKYKCGLDGLSVVVVNTGNNDCSGELSIRTYAFGTCVSDPVTQRFIKFTKCKSSVGSMVLSTFILMVVIFFTII